MQTTLLGLAIALILALLAALVGPHFVHWNDHRAFFEAEASRLVGLKVRITGDIDAAILPFPSVQLTGIAVGPEDEASRLTARSLQIEFSLGSLLRGELRAVEMRLIGPTISLGLNREGQIAWPAVTPPPETLAIDRLRIEDGRATFIDAASRSRLVLDQVQFEGEVRSLTGPLRGRGFFAAGGMGYGYNISAGRLGPEGMRVRLGLETAERPETMEIEGLVVFDRAAPRFEGTLALARPAGTVLATGKAVGHEPWKLTATVQTGAQSAALSEILFQYGPHEWGTSLTGSADFKFGEQPRIEGELRARQLDLDRMLATVNVPRRLPLPAIQALSEMLGSALQPPWPVALDIAVDMVTLGGAPLQGVTASLQADGARWRVDRLQFRAPGMTQVKLNGRIEPLGRTLGFGGDVDIEAGDPKALVAWLAGQPAAGAQIRPWRVTGAVALGADRIAVENLRAEFDKSAVDGRVAYFWPAGNRPARLDAELRAGEIDLDAVIGFSDAAFAGLALEWPREAALAFEIGRARIAGFEARNASAQLKFDGNGIAIERLSIADFGDAKIEARGQIQTSLPQGGNITVDLDARELGGLIALAETVAPSLAEPLRRLRNQQKDAKLRVGVSLTNTGSGDTRGALNLSGRIGAVRISVAVGATGRPSSFRLADLSALGDAEKTIDGRFEADNSDALLALIGLERIAMADPRPGRLIFSAGSAGSGDLRFEGKLSAGPIDASGQGTLALAHDQPVTLDLNQFSGTIGGNQVDGKLAVRFGDTPRIDGALQAETLNVPATIAAAIGLPGRIAEGAEGWSSAPFAAGGAGFAGRITFKAERATIAHTAVAHQLRGVARFGPDEIAFDEVTGEFANGRLEGRLTFGSGPTGLSARVRVALNGVEAGAIFTEGEQPPVAGRLTLQAELAGSGRSPAALFGSLSGTGNIRIEGGQLAGLNPGVFDAVVRAAELGMPTEGRRLREFTTGVLDGASLKLSKAEAAINVAAGQARFSNVVLRTAGADLEVTANLDLATATLDALFTLTGLPASAGAVRPMLLVALRGELPALERTVDTSLLASWLTLRAVEQQSQQIDALEKARGQSTPLLPLDSKPAPPEVTSSTPREGLSDRAPPLPPPVNVPAIPQPAGAPRAESAPPRAPSAPAPTTVGPPS